jgi:hypothetical protein
VEHSVSKPRALGRTLQDEDDDEDEYDYEGRCLPDTALVSIGLTVVAIG